MEWREHIGKAVSGLKAGLRWELVDGPRRGDLMSKDLYIVAWHPQVDESIEAGSEAGSLLPDLIAELEKGELREKLSTSHDSHGSLRSSRQRVSSSITLPLDHSFARLSFVHVPAMMA